MLNDQGEVSLVKVEDEIEGVDKASINNLGKNNVNYAWSFTYVECSNFSLEFIYGNTSKKN